MSETLSTAQDLKARRKIRDSSREKRIMSLYTEGLTKVDIASRIGASEFYVRCVVKRLGLKR